MNIYTYICIYMYIYIQEYIYICIFPKRPTPPKDLRTYRMCAWCVAVCCSVLQCITVCCIVIQ